MQGLMDAPEIPLFLLSLHSVTAFLIVSVKVIRNTDRRNFKFSHINQMELSEHIKYICTLHLAKKLMLPLPLIATNGFGGF